MLKNGRNILTEISPLFLLASMTNQYINYHVF